MPPPLETSASYGSVESQEIIEIANEASSESVVDDMDNDPGLVQLFRTISNAIRQFDDGPIDSPKRGPTYGQRNRYIKKSISNYLSGKEMPSIVEYDASERVGSENVGQFRDILNMYHQVSEEQGNVLHKDFIHDDQLTLQLQGDLILLSVGNKIQQKMIIEMKELEYELYIETQRVGGMYDIPTDELFKTITALDGVVPTDHEQLRLLRAFDISRKEKIQENDKHIEGMYGRYSDELLYALLVASRGGMVTEEQFWGEIDTIETSTLLQSFAAFTPDQISAQYGELFLSLQQDPERNFLFEGSRALDEFFISAPSFLNSGELIARTAMISQQRLLNLAQIEEQLMAGKNILELHSEGSEGVQKPVLKSVQLSRGPDKSIDARDVGEGLSVEYTTSEGNTLREHIDQDIYDAYIGYKKNNITSRGENFRDLSREHFKENVYSK